MPIRRRNKTKNSTLGLSIPNRMSCIFQAQISDRTATDLRLFKIDSEAQGVLETPSRASLGKKRGKFMEGGHKTDRTVFYGS